MRKELAWSVGIFAVLLLVTALITYQSTGATPLPAIPTTIPDLPGPPGDFVSRSYGGQYLNGIAVKGGADESQLVVVGNSTQTAATPLVRFENFGGTPVASFFTTGVMQLGGVAFTGPIKYGTAVVTTTGYITVAHGFSAAPTMAIMVCGTAGYTASVTTLGTTVLNGYGSCIAGAPVYWIAGQ